MGFTSPPIGEAAAGGLRDDLGGAFGILDAQCRAIVVAEIELSQLAVKVAFAAMLMADF